MATKKTKNADDDRKAIGRFMDQPGQWQDATPASVKKRQAKEWKKLEEMLKKDPPKKRTGTKKKGK